MTGACEAHARRRAREATGSRRMRTASGSDWENGRVQDRCSDHRADGRGRGLDERVDRLASSWGLPGVAVEASMVLLVVTYRASHSFARISGFLLR